MAQRPLSSNKLQYFQLLGLSYLHLALRSRLQGSSRTFVPVSGQAQTTNPVRLPRKGSIRKQWFSEHRLGPPPCSTLRASTSFIRKISISFFTCLLFEKSYSVLHSS